MKSEIIEMWNNGVGSGDISRHFGVTRNSVMGTVSRAQKEGLAVKKKEEATWAVKKTVSRPKPKKESPPVDDKGIKAAEKYALSNKRIGPATTTLPVTKQPAKMVTMMELTPYHCRWMYGSDMFCGEATESILKPWCEEHRKIVYTPRKSRSVNSSRTIQMANFNFSRVR